MKRPSPFQPAITIALLGFLATTASAELTPQQKQFVRTIQQRLDQAATNLKAAQDAAGPDTATPTDSRAKLALTRSASARSQLATVQDAVKQLPADDPATKALLEQVTKIDTSITTLETRLTGKPDTAKPSTAGVKLDYQQEKLLKDAQSYLAEVEGAAAALDKIVQQVKAAKDPDLLDYHLLADAAATIDKARGRKKYMDDYFAKLPPDGAGVASTHKQVDDTMARIDTAAKILDPIHARLQKIIDPGTYPALNADLARIKALGSMFSDTTVFQSHPARAADIARQLPAAAEEHARISKVYVLFLYQKAETAKPLDSALSFLHERQAGFATAADERKKNLPAEIQADLKKALDIADKAAADKNPLLYTGGVPQQLGNATTRLNLLAAIDPAAAPPLEKALADTRTQLNQKQATLRELIIAQNTLPPDRYTGPDKADLASRATAAWKQKQPDARILAVRIPSEKWERETFIRRQNNTWYVVDRSSLQAQVIIQLDDKTAAIQPINLWIDHVDNNKLTALPMNEPKDTLQPSSLLPLAKAQAR